MRDRAEKILRYAGLTLGALVALQLIIALFQACQLVGVKVPAVPALETESNSTAVAVSPQSTVHRPQSGPGTNTVMPEPAKSNKPGITNLAMLDPRNANSNFVSTNGIASAGTNTSKKHYPRRNQMPGMAMNGAPMMPGMPGHGPALPPEIQAQVDQIVNSGIFGPVIRPPPMGLLGIAGDTAFLRTDSGQSGLVKEGDSLGDLKLLKIGVNRVLVEQDGQPKELTIFDGYGGDSLLSNKTENSNENIQSKKQAN